MKLLPKSRTENIVVQELGKELLIYDLQTHRAFCLNETSATVFRACDGITPFSRLMQSEKYTEDLIFLALDQFNTGGLIEVADSYVSPLAGMNRREAIRKVGMATMIALPVISNLLAPSAADAQSSSSCVPSGGICISNNFTQSNCCTDERCYSTVNPPICGNCAGFIFASCAQVGGCQNCDTSPRKNACCNTGTAQISGGSCYCPGSF